jgi:hypothetical protein
MGVMTQPIDIFPARTNPNVGWAKQVRHAIEADALDATFPSQADCGTIDGACFAPTSTTTSLISSSTPPTHGGHGGAAVQRLSDRHRS